LWNIHKNEIGKITGVTNPQDYLNNPEAQEKYQSHLESQYKRNVPGLRKRFPGVTKGIDDEVLMALQHLSGLGDARIYLDTLEKTKSYDTAQQALNQSIEKRTGQAPPTNKTVFEYLNNFSENLEKDNTPKEPQIFAPKKQSQVNPNPTFTASPFVAPKVASKPVAKKEEEPFFKMPNFSISDFTLPKMPNVEVDFNFKTTGAVGKWLYETLAPVAGVTIDEDVVNIFDYLKNGGAIGDVTEIYDNYKAKKGGSEKSDLIGESKKITPTVDAQTALFNWGYYKKPAESLVKKNYVVDTKQVSDSPSVDKDVYTSRAFMLNLKSDENKFSVLNNIHGNSGIGNIDGFYKNFQPISGSIVFTMQNDQVSNQKPLTTITKNDKWYEGSDYLIKLNSNNTIEVAKTSSLKEGDNVFKLKDKIFSFDDFDIKDGKINTTYNTNVNALIPVIKSDAKTYKQGSSFVIGLTDKKKTAGYLPLDEATQYGKSRGGSFILFSEDLSQQYMVGGSFKNLYDFYQDVKKLHPNKKFKVFTSDTGSYSNSFFPKSGKIDGDVYRKSNLRNTWGEVQHIVLMN
jgi:hypothetical protein